MSEPVNPPSRIETVRLLAAKAGFAVSTMLLVAGLVAGMAARDAAARHLITVAVVVLVLMPATGVIALLAEEVRRRDWWFVGVASGVLLLLIDSLVRVVLMN